MVVSERARQVWALARDRQLTVAAAGVAYHAFNTLLPTLVLAVLAVSVSGEAAYVVDQLSQYGGISAAQLEVVANAVRDNGRVGSLVVVAALIATWSALQMGRAIASVFTTIYGDQDYSFLERAASVVLVFLTWLVALSLLVVLGIVLAYLRTVGPFAAAWPAFLFVGLFVAFVPMYLIFPPDATLLEALPGAALAAGSWTLSGLVFRAYAGNAASVELFGVVGVVLLLLTWLYLGSLSLVVGAATNAVLADRVAEPRT